MPNRIALVGLFACLLSPPAHADGAFPDSLGILLPKDEPHELIAATNFGLLVSTDDGAHVDWICEQAIGTNAYLYQVGPAPDDTLYAISLDGLSVSTDDGCSWQPASLGPSVIALDAFPDPRDPLTVLAVGQPPQGDASFYARSVYRSRDRGLTFPETLFTPPLGNITTGVEQAASADEIASTFYLYDPITPQLALGSSDGGWTSAMLSGAGARIPRLLAIDPADPTRIYLRLSSTDGKDALARWSTTTQTLTVLKELGEAMTAFVVRADHSLLFGTGSGLTYATTDGSSFTAISPSPHLRALGERDGTLYAVADNYNDGFAVGTSSDGKDWKHLFAYGQIRGIRQCGNLPQICAAPWENLKTQLGLGQSTTPAVSGCHCGLGETPLTLLAALVLRARRRTQLKSRLP